MTHTWILVGSLCVLAVVLCRVRALSLQLRKIETDCKGLERLLKRHGELSGEVAHEIKNPLTAILCSAETLDLVLADKIDPAYRQSLQYIKEYGDNLLHLVSDFLDLNRSDAGAIEASVEPTNVTLVAQSVVGLLDMVAVRSQVTLTISTTGCWACCDQRHLKQVLFNLVHNALKFTPPGGEVVVDILPSEESRVSVVVRDNGCGIPERQLKVIFDPYAQLDAGIRAGGSGLGLALCKRLVELSGGTIRAESVYGFGSSFHLELPEANAEGEELSTEPVGTPLQGQHILVVDEDSGTRQSVASLIEAWGGMVDQVGIAADAVTALKLNHYDAVMIDASLDGGFGCELARFLKESVVEGETTVIVARGTQPEVEMPAVGVDQIVQKPLNGRALLTSLMSAVREPVTH